MSHCIFPVRNDVGSALRDDVVVILSIRGKGLGGTGHLGLANVEQIVCPLSGRGKEKEKRRNDAKRVPHLRGFFPLSAYSSQISAAMTSLWPGSCDHRGRLAARSCWLIPARQKTNNRKKRPSSPVRSGFCFTGVERLAKLIH